MVCRINIFVLVNEYHTVVVSGTVSHSLVFYDRRGEKKVKCSLMVRQNMMTTLRLVVSFVNRKARVSGLSKMSLRERGKCSVNREGRTVVYKKNDGIPE